MRHKEKTLPKHDGDYNLITQRGDTMLPKVGDLVEFYSFEHANKESKASWVLGLVERVETRPLGEPFFFIRDCGTRWAERCSYEKGSLGIIIQVRRGFPALNEVDYDQYLVHWLVDGRCWWYGPADLGPNSMVATLVP